LELLELLGMPVVLLSRVFDLLEEIPEEWLTLVVDLFEDLLKLFIIAFRFFFVVFFQNHVFISFEVGKVAYQHIDFGLKLEDHCKVTLISFLFFGGSVFDRYDCGGLFLLSGLAFLGLSRLFGVFGLRFL